MPQAVIFDADSMKTATMTITVSPSVPYRVRLWIALVLFRVAVWCVGCEIRVVNE